MKAFLHTTPEGSQEPRGVNWAGGEPDTGDLGYLGEYLFEIGPLISTNQGNRPIDWVDLSAWQSVTGERLNKMELKAIIDLSCAYLHQHRESLEPDSIPPWGDHTKVDHAALAARRRSRRQNG